MLRAYNPDMITYNEIIDGWRNKVAGLTRLGGEMLLRHLGGFEKDEVLIRPHGIYTVKVCDLWQYYAYTKKCVNIYPVYFTGGPTGERRFRGTLLTLVIDRMLATCIEKGDTHVSTLVEYIKSFNNTMRGVV